MAYFMISVDTEGDNQWDNSKGISTQNVRYLPRFQELCEKYGFKPVWLTNYEMALDDEFVKYFKAKQDQGLCEIGMHLHAWYTPPEYELEYKTDERSYLIEYPVEVMREKIVTMTNLISDRFGKRAISHRSGRWAMDDRYFQILSELGYKVDCSVTPHVSWEKNLGATGIGGTDYSDYSEKPFVHEYGLLEIPVTIRKEHYLDIKRINSVYTFLREIKHWLVGVDQWLRFFDIESGYGVRKLSKHLIRDGKDVLFMIHSSELMPAGSPSFSNESDIEKLYIDIEEVFKIFSCAGYKGCTMEQYYNIFTLEKNND